MGPSLMHTELSCKPEGQSWKCEDAARQGKRCFHPFQHLRRILSRQMSDVVPERLSKKPSGTESSGTSPEQAPTTGLSLPTMTKHGPRSRLVDAIWCQAFCLLINSCFSLEVARPTRKYCGLQIQELCLPLWPSVSAGLSLFDYQVSSGRDILPPLWHSRIGWAHHKPGCRQQRVSGWGTEEYHGNQKRPIEFSADSYHAWRKVETLLF